jgi:uncharacterized membrane protein YfcA
MHDGIQRDAALARSGTTFVAGAVVGILGGLIGLGGAEFHLPLLIGLFALLAHQAVRLNLLVSLATVIASVAARFGFATFPDLAALIPEILAVTAGAVVAAWVGTGLLARLSVTTLTRTIAALLVLVGALLLTEAVVSDVTESGGAELLEKILLRSITVPGDPSSMVPRRRWSEHRRDPPSGGQLPS